MMFVEHVSSLEKPWQKLLVSPAVFRIPQETYQTPAGPTRAQHEEIVLGRVEMPWDMPWLAGKFPGPWQ